MPDDIRCNVFGLDRIEKFLEEIGPRAAKNAIRRAAKKGTAIWQEAIEENAPHKTGFLEEHIAVSSVTGNFDEESDTTTGSVAVMTGPSKQAFYGLFSEFGTKHESAHPFVTPAYEDHKEEVLQTFMEELAKAFGTVDK